MGHSNDRFGCPSFLIRKLLLSMCAVVAHVGWAVDGII